MTKLINADELINSFDNSDFDNTDPADNLMNAVHIVNSMPYVEAYSKEEVIAMLVELVKEINPIKECEQQIYGKEEWNFVGKCQDVIQQKIDKIEENA